MDQSLQSHARVWQLSSTILLALAITATTWIVSAAGYLLLSQSNQAPNNGQLCILLAYLCSLIVLVIFLTVKWKSIGSSKLYKSELIIGCIILLAGGIYAYYGYVLGKAHTPTGMYSGLKYALITALGIYIACIGTLTALAGFIGMLSHPKIRENS